MPVRFAAAARAGLPGSVLWCALALALVAADARPAQAQNGDAPPGAVIWQGPRPALGLADIASLAAPVLWFSPEEPFLIEGDRHLPHVHPCDEPASSGVVYYQVTRARLRRGDRVGWPAEEDPFFFDKVESFTLRYFFYYTRDTDRLPRPHDLEAIDLQVALDMLPSGEYRVRLTQAVGLAVGEDWYSSPLAIGADTRLPLTVLVEEGTHSTAPDRNADGLYSPGYDVNRRVYDAWGVRDMKTMGLLGPHAYRPTMTKLRRAGTRMLPPDIERPPVENGPLSSLPEIAGELGRYELRSASNVRECAVIPPGHQDLRTMMTRLRFGPEHRPDQYVREWLNDLTGAPGSPSGFVPNVSVRWDRAFGASLLFRSVDLHGLYVVPRITAVNRDASLEALFTRSAAQPVSWYFSMGSAREYYARPNEPAEYHWNFVSETGIKLRVRVTGKYRLFTMGYPFAGVRLGVRTSGFDSLRPLRFIAEFGVGIW